MLSAINHITDQIARAIMRHESTFALYEYDEANDTMLPTYTAKLPAPQTTGTSYQAWTYAKLKARPIAESLAQEIKNKG
jgi:hypothetical protein